MTVGRTCNTNSAKRRLVNKTISNKHTQSKMYGNKDYWFLVMQGTSNIIKFTDLSIGSSGNIYLSGTIGSTQFYFNKIDRYGNIVYQRMVNGGGSGRGIDTDSSGNLYLLDTASQVIKINEAGDTIIWARGIGSVVSQARGISVDPITGNVFVGIIPSWNSSGAANGFIGYTSDGTYIPGKTFWHGIDGNGLSNGTTSTILRGIAARDGGVYLNGYGGRANQYNSLDNGSETKRVFTTRYAQSTGSSWQKYLKEQWSLATSEYSIYGSGIAVDSSNNSYVSYYRNPSAYRGWSSGNGFIAKYNSAGSLLWQTSASPVMAKNDITVDTDGNVYIIGNFSTSSGLAFGDIYSGGTYLEVFIAKYDTSGNLIWARSLSHTGGYFEAYTIKVDSNSIFICGNVGGSISSGGTSGFVAKLPKDGSGLGVCLPFIYKKADNYGASASAFDVPSMSSSIVYAGGTGFNDYVADGVLSSTAPYNGSALSGISTSTIAKESTLTILNI